MDNADLTKLIVAPGKLSPKFNANVTSYSVTVGSNVAEVKLTALTSDSGASYCIKVCIVEREIHSTFLRLGWRWWKGGKVI